MPGLGSTGKSLTIVGGTYVERCQTPRWAEIFGSGFRAACAVSGRAARVELQTYLTDDQEKYVKGIATSLSFEVAANRSEGTVEFDYRHPLSRPDYAVTHKGVYEMPPLHVESELVLAFGMIEANPIVTGDRVVYDPQAPDDPTPFNQNGSNAEHIALVLNRSEARSLSQKQDIDEAGATLLENAEVVVIKSGPQGAFVYTGSGAHRVPSFRTKRAFLIGSGDVFSASFAYAWAVQRYSPEESAAIASLSTAHYCQTATVPIPTVLPPELRLNEVPAGGRPRIYLAGPFFSLQQLWMVEEARACLTSQGAIVFSPFHDVGFGQPAIVAEADLAELHDCDGVFALLDGHDPGTIFEVGYARALGKPVTVFTSSTDPIHLTMFSGSSCTVFHDFATAVYNCVWNL